MIPSIIPPGMENQTITVVDVNIPSDKAGLCPCCFTSHDQHFKGYGKSPSMFFGRCPATGANITLYKGADGYMKFLC